MRIEPRDQPLLKNLLDHLGIVEPRTSDESDYDLTAFPAYSAEEPARAQVYAARRGSRAELAAGSPAARSAADLRARRRRGSADSSRERWRGRHPLATVSRRQLGAAPLLEGRAARLDSHPRERGLRPHQAAHQDQRCLPSRHGLLESAQRGPEPSGGAENPRLGQLLPSGVRESQRGRAPGHVAAQHQEYELVARHSRRHATDRRRASEAAHSRSRRSSAHRLHARRPRTGNRPGGGSPE